MEQVAGDGQADLIGDSSIDITVPAHDGNEAILEAKRATSSTICQVRAAAAIFVLPCDWRSAGRVRPFGRPRPRSHERCGFSQRSRVLRFLLWPRHRQLPDVRRPRLVSAPVPRSSPALVPHALLPWPRLWPDALPAVRAGSVLQLPLRHDSPEEAKLLHPQRQCGDRRGHFSWCFSNPYSVRIGIASEDQALMARFVMSAAVALSRSCRCFARRACFSRRVFSSRARVIEFELFGRPVTCKEL